MKKTALTLLLATSWVFADSYQKAISELLSQKTHREIEAKRVIDFKGSDDLKIIILYDKQDKTEIAVLATKDGNIVVGLSNIFLSKNDSDLETLAQAYKSTQPEPTPPDPKALNEFFSSLEKNRVISLSSKAKKSEETFYIVSDPRCPGCRKELDAIEEKLQKGDVKMLLVSFLGQESAYKAKLIYEKTAKLKDNASKIKVLKEIYDPNYALTPKDKTQDIKMIEQNSEEVSKIGIQSVPFIHSIKK